MMPNSHAPGDLENVRSSDSCKGTFSTPPRSAEKLTRAKVAPSHGPCIALQHHDHQAHGVK